MNQIYNIDGGKITVDFMPTSMIETLSLRSMEEMVRVFYGRIIYFRTTT